MKLLKGYLAHPVLTRENVAIWEHNFELRTGIDLVNPFQGVGCETDHDLQVSEDGDYSHASSDEIVMRCLNSIRSCDFMVAFVTGVRSYGTIMEICYACSMGKPVFIICENGHENHPWLVYHSTKIFTNTKDFQIYITEGNDYDGVD